MPRWFAGHFLAIDFGITPEKMSRKRFACGSGESKSTP
jgi:hypothetical protein